MQRKKREQLGFVGLGNMGQPIALRMLQAMQAESDLCVFDQRVARMEPLVEQGARSVDRLADVAQSGGIVFTMVPDDQALLQVALGEGGILHQLGTGGIHVSLSTVSPDVSVRLAQLYKKQGCSYLAATVLGRPDVAARGELSIFLTGDLAAKLRIRPFLVTVGHHLYDLGKNVALANIAKISYNFLIASAIEAMGEAAALVEAYGMDRKRFMRMLVESVLFRGTVYEGYGQMIGERDFSDARFPVALGLKDVELTLHAGQLKDVELPYADITYEHLLNALDAGRGSEDWAVLSDFARPGALSERQYAEEK